MLLELNMFGDIGVDVTARAVAESLSGLGPDDTVAIKVNSFGGSIAEGIAIYSLLKATPAKTICIVEGVAASAAVMILCGCDEAEISEPAMVMIHKAWSPDGGNSDELTKTTAALRKIDAEQARIYSAKTGKKLVEVQAMMDAEVFLNSGEALSFGLVDRVVNGQALVAFAPPAGYKFRIPQALVVGGAAKQEKEMADEVKKPEDELKPPDPAQPAEPVAEVPVEVVVEPEKPVVEVVPEPIVDPDKELNEKIAAAVASALAAERMAEEDRKTTAVASAVKSALAQASVFAPGLAVSPAVTGPGNWREALAHCKQDYAAAVRQFPTLRPTGK